ncbi:peptide/nickel transport system substrate-binding protein [Breoghania corrubedonensis]|uniref:Peptide/nickel transport system substrate-binding protein n=1 Tax=Breoghania corrubedonensis TaxID=665038 RepID=A0A2T5VC73_9HYPH|nr:ABC transporter substrate-binding protein [Breoghania corrubedonensis]PTW61353.1 peptide/nickel transport system substrate-binding protein [Breoghania corrubedonensis]
MNAMFKALGLGAIVLGASLSGAAAVERGGILTYARQADSRLLDPVYNQGNVNIWVLSSMYDTLILPTDDGKGLKPGLATNWQVSKDGLTVTLHLRDDIKFSDGTPITAEDVRWSLERAANPEHGIWNFMLGSIDNVEARDEKTILLHLKHTDPAILPALSVFNAAIMPEKQYEATKGASDEDKAKTFAQHPVGSGPFVLTTWERGSSMKLARNPHYWAKGEDGKPLPYLDGINFEIIPDDATRILKLQSGEIDGAEMIPYARVNELKQDPAVDMELFPSTRVQYVTLNVRPKLEGEKNPLFDLKVRQALNYAANKQAIIQIVTHGVGKPMTSFMSSGTPMQTGTKPLYPYDLAKAKALLKDAGYPDGFETSIMVIAGNQDEIGIATTLQQMWSQLGVKLDIQQVDDGTRDTVYRNGTFHMRLSVWTDDIADPSEFASYALYPPTIGALHTGWSNDKATKLFEASQQELDPKKRLEEYAQMQKIFNTSGPTVPLYETPYAVALSKNLHGFNQIPLGNNIFRWAWLSR